MAASETAAASVEPLTDEQVEQLTDAFDAFHHAGYITKLVGARGNMGLELHDAYFGPEDLAAVHSIAGTHGLAVYVLKTANDSQPAILLHPNRDRLEDALAGPDGEPEPLAESQAASPYLVTEVADGYLIELRDESDPEKPVAKLWEVENMPELRNVAGELASTIAERAIRAHGIEDVTLEAALAAEIEVADRAIARARASQS